MTYRLVIVTHGDSKPLSRTLASFDEHVSPRPADCVVVYDGPMADCPKGLPWPDATLLYALGVPVGFCTAVRIGWNIACEWENSAVDHVFWLEHDFRFVRPVDLEELASVLHARPQLAQMALMRDAVSPAEKDAGGLVQSRPGQYERRMDALVAPPAASKLCPWLEHTAYFTTNPSLMRRDFMREHPWPDYPEGCEGRFGIDLAAQGFTFGAWGAGEPWVKHTGVRTGFGY